MSGEDEERALLGELKALYEEADVLFSGSSCPASSECCRFARTGREPYVTSIELALVLAAVKRRGGSYPATPAPLHTKDTSLPVLRDERPCPLLDPNGRCSIYEERPLGCRTFFCDRATELSRVRHKDLLSIVARLKEIAVRHESGGDEGRPLTRALALGRSIHGRPGVNNSRARSSKLSR